MFFSFIILLFINFFLFYYYKNISKIYNLFDVPDFKRKIHSSQVPLLGGLFVILNLTIIIFFDNFFFKNFYNEFFLSQKNLIFFLVFSFLIYLLGFYDDKYNVSANIKFILLIFLILLLIIFNPSLKIDFIKLSFYEKTIHLNSYSYFFTILSFLLFMNAFNMLDGINGQSGSYAFFILILFTFNNIFLFLSAGIMVCLFFFLLLNFKNKIYLGDSGSLLLGFILSYLFIISYNLNGTFFADEIFLVMSVPGFDLMRLFIKRLINNKNPFFSDQSHLHHILLKKVGYLKTFFIVQLLFIFPYIFYLFTNNFIISFSITLIIYAFIIYHFDQSNFNKKKIKVI
jgi:UDP-GlcNAc:undecaprenyl-phosphate/decaprenyl-phosphate GlcNAc-1-phosphate transferase